MEAEVSFDHSADVFSSQVWLELMTSLVLSPTLRSYLQDGGLRSA